MPLESSFPAAFREADRASERSQNAFYRISGVRLFALCLVGVLPAVGLRWAAMGVAVVFGIALVLELIVFMRRPERAWYDERACAESVKTLAWRYAVGGAPFSQEDSDALFAQRVQDVAGRTESPTDAMRDARASSFDARRDLYKRERIEDQLRWYTKNARSNDRQAGFWLIVLVLVEAGAFIAALLRAMGKIHFDLFGIIGALGASAAAWTQTLQHETLSAAYKVAADELAIIASRVDDVHGETAWAEFVADAEEAMSREHTMWRAKRR